MATYREIHGKAIKSVSTDPSAETDAGQIWYNTTSNTFKSINNLEAWSSSSPLITPRARNQGAGTTSAGLSFGGMNPPGNLYANTEEYNGTGWTAGGALPSTVFDHAGDGVQTSAFSAGGQQTDPGTSTTASAEYNGTSWTAGGSISTARKKLMGLGVSNTAGLIFGGQLDTGPAQTATEEYDGSSWTAGGSLNTARAKGAGSGTQTAGLGFGGYVPGAPAPTARVANTEEYNGSSWSEVNDLNNGSDGLAGFGTQTASMAAVGYLGPPGKTTATEIWDGTNWTTSPATVASARNSLSGAGTTSAGWIAGGYGPPGSVTGDTEEYNSSISAVTAGAWAAGGNYPSSVQGMGAAGTQTATVTAGGAGPTNLACTYDGSSWTTITNYPISVRDVTGTGVQTAGFMISGYQSSPPPTGNREKTNYWNGSAWVAGGDLNNSTTRQLGGSAGVLTAALYWGGDGGTPITAFESYNGSAWTALTATPFGGNSSGCGTSTAALATPGPSVNSYEWGGSSWTAGGNMPVANQYANLTGTQTDAIHYGGYVGSSYYAGAIAYDGTTWSTRPSMATARGIIGHGTAGTSTSALATAGYAGPGGQNATEEFTGETTAVNVKTLTQS